MTLSHSPNRHSFQLESYIKRQLEKGLTPENDEDTRAMVHFYENLRSAETEREMDKEWAKDNLEYDLRSTKWICDKVKASESYAQNLYAAMCNNDFQKLDTWPILTDKRWHCSWRYAGGIVADMREKGDYIDWYCSGIRGGYDLGGGEIEDPHPTWVNESVVTDEIRKDLTRLGWIVIEHNT